MRRGAAPGLLLLLAALAGGCASSPEPLPYLHNRTDYEAFRATHPDLLEPNYLPFMAYEVPAGRLPLLRRLELAAAHALGLPGPRVPRRLVFCHWAPEDLPLKVWIEPPRIPESLKDELRPVAEPSAYVDAVRHAMAIWQRDLDGQIAFQPVASAGDAMLRVKLLGQVAPSPDPSVRVLGSTALGRACEVEGGDPDRRLQVRYRVRDLRIFIADEFGLLLPDQVERVALHELGHALGMRGHSPIPADLMYPVARDRIPREGLGASDVNSFLSLYALPNGTVYTDPDHPVAPHRLRVPPPVPRLALAPHVDTNLGIEVQVPEGWTRITTPYGVVAVDGVAWDYEASIQVNVFRMDTIEDYVARYGRAQLRDSELLSLEKHRLGGLRAETAVMATTTGTRERATLVESGDGRVVVLLAECPAEMWTDYLPWFEAVETSLTVVGPGSAKPRDYTPSGRH